MKLPLSPLRVLDLTVDMPGSIASVFLSDYGAEVIKVEPPEGGAIRRKGLHPSLYRGTRSLVADLRESGDQALVWRLAAEADVVLRPAGKPAPGLTTDALLAVNPPLVYCSISAYGSIAGFGDRPAYPSLVAARLGLMTMQAGYREGPIYLGHPGVENATAYMILISTLAALRARELSGQGQAVEVSYLDGVLALLTMSWGSSQGVATMPGTGRLEFGRRRLLLDTFECADRKVLMINTAAAGAFGRAMTVLGLDDVISPASGPVEMGSDLTDEEVEVLKQRLPGIFRTRGRDEWLQTLWENQVATLPLQPLGEAFDDEQVRHNDLVQSVVDPELGRIDVVGPPVRFSGESLPIAQPAPVLDQDGAQIRASGWAGERAPLPKQPRPLRHALEGVRVLDFGAYFAGPFADRLLGDLGADVIKVEQVTGDPMRPLADMFEAASRGKRSLALNLKADAAGDVLRRLIEEADVVHHNLRPGVAERLGYGYEQASAINPALVYCHSSGYGSTGPKATLQSFAPLHSGFVGMWFEAAGAGNPPIRSFGNEDHYNGLLGACAILLGLIHRERSGQGTFLETPQLHSALYATCHVVRRDGENVRALAGLDQGQYGRGAWDRIYPCRSGWLAVLCDSEVTRTAAAEALALPDKWLQPGALEHDLPEEAGALAAAIGARLAMRSAEEWWEAFDPLGVACEVVREDSWQPLIFDNPALQAAGVVSADEHPSCGPICSISNLFHLAGTPGVVRGRAPLIGEHTRAILTEAGIGADLIDAWQAQGILRQDERHSG